MPDLKTPSLFEDGDLPSSKSQKRMYPDGVHPNGNWKHRDVKAYLKERLDEGLHCPTCNRHAQIYKRKLNRTMALALVLLSRAPGGEYIHVPRFLAGLPLPQALKASIAGGGDYAKLRYWGLIEQEPPAEGEERKQEGRGRFRITAKGRKFVRGEIEVYKYVRVYDDQPLKCDDVETFGIREALTSKFDYDELMRGGA